MANKTKQTKTAEKATSKKAVTMKAAKAAAAKAAPKKAAAPKAAAELALHINKTGRVCFNKTAAERLGEKADYMAITVNGKAVRMTPTAKGTEGAVDINRANGRPYVSAMRLLKGLGFTGEESVDVIARPVNGTSLEFTL